MDNHYFNEQGHLNDKGILFCTEKWLEGGRLPNDVKEHLKKCTICQSELLDYRMFQDEQKGQTGISPYVLKSETKVKRYRNLKMAATLLLLATFAWIVYVLNSGGISEVEKQRRILALKEEASLPFWDAQIAEGDNMRGNGVVMLTPKLDTTLVGSTIRFQWTGQTLGDLSLELFHRDSEDNPDIYIIPLGTKQLEIENVKEGLYYWRLMHNEIADRPTRLALGRLFLLNNQ